MTINQERMIITKDGNVGIGTSAPTQRLEINGNLALPATSSASAGIIMLGGTPFIHAFGLGHNTFIGSGAGNFTMTDCCNTAVGFQALASDTDGNSNIAIGDSALFSNTSGANNVAGGPYALQSNTSGTDNIAMGSYALNTNTSGAGNRAIGSFALHDNTTQGANVAIGSNALYS